MVTKGKRDRRRAAGVRGPAGKFPDNELTGEVAISNLLTLSKREVIEAEQALRRNVRSARRAGMSWQKIGDALGVTNQSVQRKYGPYPEKAPRVPRSPKAAVEVTRPVTPLKSK